MGELKDEDLWNVLPSAVWEIDFSRVTEWIEAQGFKDLKSFKLFVRSDTHAMEACIERLRVTRVSQGAVELAQAEDAKACASGSRGLLTAESRADVLRILLAAFRGQTELKLETTILTLKGELREVRAHWKFLPDAAGRFTRALVSAVDVTEERELQHRLSLAERMSAVGTLTASVVHEIKNPLTFVWSHLNELHSDGALSGETARLVSEALDGADRIRKVTADISELSSGSISDDVELLALDEVLESAVRITRSEHQHKARIVKDYEVADVFIRAPRTKLGQVFVNLIVNAAQAMPGGDRVRQSITIRTRLVDGDRVCIEIKDTGPGVPPELLNRVFDPFVTTKAPGRGTGLGLSICQRIVSGLGGNIELLSEPGDGATARIVLPRATEMAKRPSSPPAPIVTAVRPITSGQLRVLVIDDEPIIGRLLVKALSAHEVVYAPNGKSAVDKLAGETFDVVLCDLIMPEMSGMDVYEAIQMRCAPLHERIVFMTGGAFTKQARMFLDRIPNAHIEKPFDLNQLERVLVNVGRRKTESGFNWNPVDLGKVQSG